MALRTEFCQYVWDDGLDPELYERSPARPYVQLKQFYQRDIDLAQAWCDAHGYTELHGEQGTPNPLWAFPPAGAMPVPLDMNEVREWNNANPAVRLENA